MRLVRVRVPEDRWVFFGLAVVAILMSAIDGTILTVALPTLVTDLDASLVSVGWTLTSYALVQTVMMPLAGKLAERFGQMRVFVGCVFLFTLGSLLCSLAPNIYALIACRVIQAVGGGGFFPAATGIVAQLFPTTRSRMIGLFASIFPIGGILGPNIGGAVIEHFGWRQVFLLSVPMGVLVIAALLKKALAPPPPRSGARQPIDTLGTLLFAVTVVGFLSAITLVANDPSVAASPLFWSMIGGSAIVLWAFVWQERRAPDPIVDLSLVARPPFVMVNIFTTLTGACFMGFFSFIPYYARVQFGMGPMESGLILTPRSVAMIVMSTCISFLLARLGYRVPMLVGMVSVTSALLLLGLAPLDLAVGGVPIDPLVPMMFMMTLSGFGMGVLVPASSNAGLDLLPRRTAVISGLRGLFMSTGGVVGTAIIVLWLELSPDKAVGMRAVFTALGVVMLLATPIVFLIPDRATERRRAEARAAEQSAEAERAAARARIAATAPTPARREA